MTLPSGGPSPRAFSQASPKRHIPYGHHVLDEGDIEAVVDVLRSDWLTTGPTVPEFEHAVAEYVGASEGVAVSSGTSALHAAAYAAGIGPGDEVIVPAMTFAASANCVVFQGGTPVFVDVRPDTLLMDPAQVEAKVTPSTKAIIAVDYAGQPCDYDAFQEMARRRGLTLIDDACHALGAAYHGQKVGSLADLNVFSFHPVKHITTGEGGMVTTNDARLAQRMRLFRNHGITTDFRERERQESWYYEMVDLGYNYRITDIQCALGISQMKKLDAFVARRQAIAASYDKALSAVPGITPLGRAYASTHAFHLYVVLLDHEEMRVSRSVVFQAMRNGGVGVNVHYIPVHVHPYYQRRFGTGPGLCPVAESAYGRMLSLPIFPAMEDDDVDYVVSTLKRAMQQYSTAS